MTRERTIISSRQELSDNGQAVQFYPVLKSNAPIFSRKYGEITFSDKEIDAMVRNFYDGAAEILLTVNELHTDSRSFGIIKEVRAVPGEGGKELQLGIEWNPTGKEAIQNKEWLYLSIEIDSHLNSKTGEKTSNVIEGVALTNTPIFKQQDPLYSRALSESYCSLEGVKLAGILDGETPYLNTNPVLETKGIDMDKIQKLFEDLLAQISDASKDESQKAMVVGLWQKFDAAIDSALGMDPAAANDNPVPETETPAEDAGEAGDKTDETVPPSKDDKALDATAMSEKKQMAFLASEMRKLSEENKAMRLELTERTFKEKYGKKLTPAEFKAYFTLFCSDPKNTSTILDAKADLKIGSVELGSGQAHNFVELSEEEVDQKMSAMITSEMASKKVNFTDAEKILRGSNDEFKKLSEMKNAIHGKKIGG